MQFVHLLLTAPSRYILWIVTPLLLSSCSKPAEKEVEAPQVRTVTLGEIKRESIDRVIAAEGVLFAKDQSAVTAKFAAPISRILVNRGDHVQKGQLIAVLESRDLAASVNDTKGAVDQARGSCLPARRTAA